MCRGDISNWCGGTGKSGGGVTNDYNIEIDGNQNETNRNLPKSNRTLFPCMNGSCIVSVHSYPLDLYKCINTVAVPGTWPRPGSL